LVCLITAREPKGTRINACISSRFSTVIQVLGIWSKKLQLLYWAFCGFTLFRYVLRHAWLNLWDERILLVGSTRILFRYQHIAYHLLSTIDCHETYCRSKAFAYSIITFFPYISCLYIISHWYNSRKFHKKFYRVRHAFLTTNALCIGRHDFTLSNMLKNFDMLKTPQIVFNIIVFNTHIFFSLEELHYSSTRYKKFQIRCDDLPRNCIWQRLKIFTFCFTIVENICFCMSEIFF